MLTALVERARERQENGEVDALADRLKASAGSYATAPPALGLPRASKDRQHSHDPSIVMPYDLKDEDGRVLWPAGTTVNPLEQWQLKRTMVFVDASDERQRTWLRQRLESRDHATDKVILTGGSPAELAKLLGRAVYFDQKGFLVRRFGISAMPGTVGADPSAPRQRLLVREIDTRQGSP